MSMDHLRSAYEEQLKDMYSAEKQLTEALPRLAKGAASQDLKQAFEQHLQATERHFNTIGQLLSQMGVNPGNKKCKGMEGLVEEASEVLKEKGDADARDAALIGAAQKAEHYEIATYGTLCAWAETLGENEAAKKLRTLLEEERQADTLLTQIAEGHLNRQAAR